MLKSLTDSIRSFWSTSTDTLQKDPVITGSKRKHEGSEWSDDSGCDPDVQIIKVEKRRKLDNHTSTLTSLFRDSVTKMADWIRPKERRPYAEDFRIMSHPSRSHHSGRASVAQENGSHSNINRIPRVNGEGNGNHLAESNKFASRVSAESSDANSHQRKGLSVYNSSFTRRPSESSSFMSSRHSTANESVRLKDKERYQQLLQLQGQRSPWERKIPMPAPGGLPAPSSSYNFTSRDIFKAHNTSIESRSVLPQRIPKESDNFLRSHIEVAELLKMTAQSSLRSKQRPRSPTLMPPPEQNTSNIDQSDCVIVEAQEPIERRVPPLRHSDHETDYPYNIESKFSQTCLKRCQTYLQEKERRKREIEEEELKAKAFEEKRRAQTLHLEKEMKYKMRIFDELPEVTEDIFVVEDEEQEEEEKLPELTDEMMHTVRSALRPGNPSDVLSEAFRLQITRRDMSTLAGLNWLNDEVINFYMNMLMERGEQEGNAKVYAFNTFFYPKIMSGGHGAVKRWTKKVDIFSVNFIIIPVHLGVHWCLCVVDMCEKKITYYDSMGATNNKCLQAVLNYINDESVAKKQTTINKADWSLINAEDNPQQMNGSDCGMFMCKYAEYITRRKEITFTQEDMPYFRQRMVYEIISKKLLQ